MMNVDQEEANKEIFIKDIYPYFTSYFNKDKLRERIPSYTYLITELNKLNEACHEKEFLHIYQKKTLLKSLNVKRLCRNGIPIKYMKSFILKMFHIEYSNEYYDNKCRLVFKRNKDSLLGSFVPLFTNLSFEESLPVHYLNDKGIEALKEILWLLNTVIGNIEYSPLIIKITSVLLIFLTKEDTYEIMRTLLEINLSPVALNKIRWHFRYTYNDNKRISSSMHEAVFNLSDDATAKKLIVFKQNGCSSESLFQDLFGSFFLDYFNFVGVIRFLPFFLYEGTKAIYRINYALLKNIDLASLKSIIEPNDITVIEEVKHKVFELQDISKIYQDSCIFKLNRKNNQYIKQEVLEIPNSHKINHYYLPLLSPQSKILSDDDLISLLALLPLEMKTLDGIQIYNSNNDNGDKDQTDLSVLYDKCSKLDTLDIIFFIIQTNTGEVFGGIMNHNLRLNEEGKWVTPKYAYLYTIIPLIQVYSYKDDENEILLCEPGAMRYGNGVKGPAISISHDLHYGWTEINTVFGVIPLTNTSPGKFKIQAMEIYLLI